MEKKVYEGYKRRTSSSAKTLTAKQSTTEQASVPQTATTKRASARLASKTSVGKPRLAMFIDVDNVGISRENLLEVLFFANGKYQIELCKLYGFSDETLPGIRDFASEYNVVSVGRMEFKQPGVNCLDSRLLIDAYECALNNKNKIDMIFVWCYPCDLTNLFEKIINLGINTATIDNSIFDCKNKFVSQTFKLYSPYNFTVEQTTYGKVKNEPTNLESNTNVENQTTPNELPTSEAIKTDETSDGQSQSQSKMIDGVIPPVLPRRTILERSNPNAPKPQPETNEESTEENSDNSASSLVDEIARKLNLNLSDNHDFNMPDDEPSPSETVDSKEVFMEMLKRAGFDDLVEEKKLKYEDTIGDL